ncbi:MAG: ribosome silencing factor [Deltaproteobacteria bacterium]|nr:ribosome silencing factor [Deltaproteobacteria bacterium]
MTPKQLLKIVVEAAEDVQAVDLLVLDLTHLTSFTDYFVICSGRSDTQVKAIGDSILKKVKDKKRLPIGVEGHREGEWVLVDFGDVVAHIFHQEVREFYNLEKLWADAPHIKL